LLNVSTRNALALCLVFFGCTAARASAEPWSDTRAVGALLVRAQFDLNPYAALLDELVALHGTLDYALAIGRPRDPIEIYLLADKRSYRRHLAEHVPNVPDRRALFVRRSGRSMVFAYRHAQTPIDLRHEVTHAYLHAALPVLPLWLDEGLAEYFETPAELRATANPHQSSVRRSARWGRIADLPALEQKRRVDQFGDADYRDAWAWVHFAFHGPPQAHQELVALIADLRANVPTAPLSERLARRLENPQHALRAHFQNWQ
jgi:hypothetical protein